MLNMPFGAVEYYCKTKGIARAVSNRDLAQTDWAALATTRPTFHSIAKSFIEHMLAAETTWGRERHGGTALYNQERLQ